MADRTNDRYQGWALNRLQAGILNVLEDWYNGIIAGITSNVVLYDDAGNPINSHISADGDYHLGVTIEQNVIADANNSSTTNLDAGNSYTFTGTATSTLGVVGLQWSLKTDQNATVYIEESPDGTNWDISYSFDYIASKGGRGETVQASQAYWRIRVVLTGTVATTYFRLQGVLCPIATPLPSELSPDGRLKSENTISGKENTDRHVWVTATNGLAISPFTRLVGTNFDGTTKDPNFWTETVVGSGSVTQSGGEIELATGVTPNSTAQYDSVRTARFVVTSPLQWQSIVKFVTAGTANNVRRIGAYNDTDGFFFELDGTTFSVGFRKGSSDTLVSSGSFNGNLGDSYTPDTNYHKFSIEWGPKGVFFYIDNLLLHKDGQGHRSNYLSLPIRIENNNSGGATADVSLDVLATAIGRYGELVTNGAYKYIAGAATTVLKYGPGNLHTVVNNDNSGSVIIYDNTAGSGTIIASIDLSKVLGTLTFDAPFNTGLTLVSTGAGVKITVVYE